MAIRTGGPDDDILFGTGDGDELYGLGGSDLLRGRAGNDLLDGGEGADVMRGRGGDDRYVVGHADDRVAERFGEGFDTVEAWIGHKLMREIENLELRGSARRGVGNDLDNRIVSLNQGSVDNVLDGGAGADFMSGGLGDDTYYVDNVGDTFEERGLQEGEDRVYSSISFTLPEDIDPRAGERAYLDDLILIGPGPINGTGNVRDNNITGTDAVNVLSGEAGGDILRGLAGDDTLKGGAGADILDGGEGDDLLIGGDQFDRFRFDGFEDDRIEDFVPVDDLIQMVLTVFTGLSGSLDEENLLLPDAFEVGPVAQDAEDRILYDSETGRVFYDNDGTGAASPIQFVTIDPGTELTHIDFHGFG